MSYCIIDIEVTEPLPSIHLAAEQQGFALIVRRKGRPIGFLMQPQPAETVLSPALLEPLLGRSLGAKVLQECIREELVPPLDGPAFPSLTVAICTKDHPEQLARCLASLRQVEVPHTVTRPATKSEFAFDVLVVDNAPSDSRTQDVVALMRGVRYVQEPKVGLDFARNRAVQEATGELLAFLDDDVTVDRGWLCGLVEAWRENPDAAAFTGLVLPYELATEAQILFEQRGGFRRGFEKIRYGSHLPNNPLYPCGSGIFGAGCNMAFRRVTLRSLGNFDEALDTGRPLPGGGDLDIFYRVVRAGYPLVYEPGFLVFHQHRRDLAGLRRQYWSWGLGFMAFVDKSYRQDVAQRSKFAALILWWFQDMARQIVKSLLGRHALPVSMLMAELWGGITGLMGEYARSSRRVARIRAGVEDSVERPGIP